MDTKKRIAIFLVIIGASLGFCGYLAFSFMQAWRLTSEERAYLAHRASVWHQLRRRLETEISLFKGDAGIVIKDLNFDWQYTFNKDKLFPSASLVKIPIMVACFAAAGEHKVGLQDTMILSDAYKTPGSGILKNFPSGSILSIERLMEIMITESDNTASNMLIDRMGFDYLNRSFAKIGLSHTNLSRKMMDFTYRKKGVENYTSAQDIAYILEKIYRRQFINSQVSEQCLTMLLNQKVKDRIPKKLPPDLPIAHKTGLEHNVCHDAGIIFSQQGDFLICVLTRSTQNSRKVKNFIADLALVIYKNFEQRPSWPASVANGQQSRGETKGETHGRAS